MLLAKQDTELTQNHSGWKANELLNRGQLVRATLSRGGGAFLGSCDRVYAALSHALLSWLIGKAR